MKKFYLLIVSLIVAMTAGAATYPDLYIRGGKFGWNASDCKEANKLTVDENGIYTIELENFSGGFKIATNTWNEHNYGAQGSTTVDLDKEYTLINSSSSSDLTPGAAWTKVTLTFDINTLTLKVTGTGAEQKITWALCGDFESSSWPNKALTGEGTELTCTVTPVKANGGFGVKKLADGIQAAWYTDNNATISETAPEATLAAGSGNTNWALTVGREYTVTFNTESGAIKFTWEGGDDPQPQPTSPDALYIVGNICNWAPENGVALTKDGDTFKATGLKLPDNGGYSWFSFTTAANAGWADMTRYGATEDSYTAEDGTPAPFVKADGDAYAFKAVSGTYDIVVDFKAMTITLTKVGGDDPEIFVPETLYIMGNVNSTNWSTSEAPELTKEGKVFTLKSVTIDAAEANEYGYFHFNELAGEDWPAVEAGHRFGAATEDEELAINAGSSKTADLVMKTDPYSFKALPGIYKVAVSFEGTKPQLELSKLSDGVENVEISNDGAAEYFNLQGIRVTEPAPGIYIKRQGSKVTKVIVK